MVAEAARQVAFFAAAVSDEGLTTLVDVIKTNKLKSLELVNAIAQVRNRFIPLLDRRLLFLERRLLLFERRRLLLGQGLARPDAAADVRVADGDVALSVLPILFFFYLPL